MDTREELEKAQRRILLEPAEVNPSPILRAITLPTCERKYMVDLSEGLIGRACRDLGLARLDGIHQLPFITPEQIGPYRMATPHWMPHTRLDHSIADALLMTELGTRLGLSEPLTQLGTVLGLVHDHALPPGGDTVMNFFGLRRQREQVDEDDQFGHRLDRFSEALGELVRDYQLPPHSRLILDESIHGRGILGELHELADTLSYLDLDSAALAHRRMVVANARHSDQTQRALALATQGIGARVLASVRRVEREGAPRLVIDDIEALTSMLEARLYLWQDVYTSRYHKYFEAMYLEILGPILYAHGRLTSDRMRDEDDEWLFDQIGETFGSRDLVQRVDCIAETGPEVLVYHDQESLLKEEERAFKSGAFTLVTHERAQARVKTKDQRYFVERDGDVVSFREGYPKHANRLQALADAKTGAEPWTLYVTRAPFTLTPPFRDAWKNARLRWHSS